IQRRPRELYLAAHGNDLLLNLRSRCLEVVSHLRQLLLEFSQPRSSIERFLFRALLGIGDGLSGALLSLRRELIGALLTIERQLARSTLGVAHHAFGPLVRPLLERLKGIQQGLASSSKAALVVQGDGHARSVG